MEKIKIKIEKEEEKRVSPWSWVPSLYLAEGLPYVIITVVSVTMYKRMGISNADIALYTGWLYLPWVIKPCWSPLVEILKAKRLWIVLTQLFIGAGLAGIALTIPLSFFFRATLAFFWLLAFASATHDIAADGFYLLGLNDKQQAMFVGIRSTCYKIATIMGQGLLVMLAGYLETSGIGLSVAWSITFFISAGTFILLACYHHRMLPQPLADESHSPQTFRAVVREFSSAFHSFFKKPQILTALFFMLTFRFSEAQLLKLISPFLLDSKASGGLGLTTAEVGFAYGTIGIIGLVVGGIIGGISASKGGLKRWLWPMTLSMLLTSATFLYLSFSQTDNRLLIHFCIVIEQFGYGFGFTAYVLYLMHFSKGERQTAHYAICTGFMALGMMIPGMFAGWLQELLGYKHFFIWVMLSGIVPLVATALLKIRTDE